MQSTVKYPEWYSHKTINDVENILGHTKPGENPATGKLNYLKTWYSLLFSDFIRLLDIQEARGFMDNCDKDNIMEIYLKWLTTSTVTFARELKIRWQGI